MFEFKGLNVRYGPTWKSSWYYWNVGYELAPAGLVPTVIWVWVELNVSLTHWFSNWRVIYCIEASIQRLGYPLYRPIDFTNYQVITRLRVCGIRTCGPFWRKRYVQEAIHIYIYILYIYTSTHIYISVHVHTQLMYIQYMYMEVSSKVVPQWYPNGTPIVGWFILENLTKTNGWFRGYPHDLGNLHGSIYIYVCIYTRAPGKKVYTHIIHQ
jgi:hypothetical protein